MPAMNPFLGLEVAVKRVSTHAQGFGGIRAGTGTGPRLHARDEDRDEGRARHEATSGLDHEGWPALLRRSRREPRGSRQQRQRKGRGAGRVVRD